MDNKSNILSTFQAATPQQLAEGLNWYKDAHELAKRWADLFNLSIEKTAGVISALSPACSWDRNKIDAFALLSNKQGHKFSSYGQNVKKAQTIIDADNDVDILSFFNFKTGAKTLNFYKNILDPKNPLAVTIDRHAAAIFEGREGSGSVALGLPRYRLIAQAYLTVAEELGITACQLQAITWTVYRSQHVAAHHSAIAPF